MIDIHALSGAYAVDALDDAERTEFERHLAECPACQAEVDSLQEAASLLAETTIGTPSEGLRDRVLAEIALVRPLPPEVGTHRAAEPDTATVTELAPRRRRRATTFLAAAAAVVAIGAGGIVWQQVGGDDDAPPSQTEQVLQASDAQSFDVAVKGGGKATVVRSKKLNQAVITTTGMSAPPAGHVFVAWLGHGTTMTQAGVMPSGAANTVVLSGDAATATGAAISIEETGDEPDFPSHDIVASVSFDA